MADKQSQKSHEPGAVQTGHYGETRQHLDKYSDAAGVTSVRLSRIGLLTFGLVSIRFGSMRHPQLSAHTLNARHTRARRETLSNARAAEAA
jgi:hypothetical protein